MQETENWKKVLQENGEKKEWDNKIPLFLLFCFYIFKGVLNYKERPLIYH